ncbi:hypothetical protein SE959_27200 [Escherichia coli]|nr:hypothetical protein [Escherichia coli]
MILVILFINMVISIASRNEEEPKENAKQETASTAPNTTEKFNALLKNSGARPSASVNQANTVGNKDSASNGNPNSETDKNLFTLTAGKKRCLRRGGREQVMRDHLMKSGHALRLMRLTEHCVQGQIKQILTALKIRLRVMHMPRQHRLPETGLMRSVSAI